MPLNFPLIVHPPHPNLPPQGGKGLRGSYSFFCICLLFSLTRSLASAEPSELRVCLLEDNLPFSSRNKDTGFDLDTAKAVAETLGRSLVPVWVRNDTRIVEIEESDFPLRRLSRNECDALFSVPGLDAVKDSPKVAIGAPYYGAAFELIGRDGSAPSSLETLGDRPVAVQAQTIANFVLNTRKAKIRTFFSIESALSGLVKGEAMVALLWGPTTGWYLQNHPELKLAVVAGYEPPTVVRWNEHVATRKSDTVLRGAIDAALAKLHAGGTLQTLLARYGIPFHAPFDTIYSLAEMQKLK